MGKEEKGWSADGSFIPTLEVHTKKKHEILTDYLHDWVVTLCGNHPLMEKKITIVDGFCGGGIYNDTETEKKWFGSPIRILKSIEAGLKDVLEKKKKPNFKLDFLLICIDENKEHLGCLKNTLVDAGYEKYIGKEIIILHSKFDLAIDKVMQKVDERKGHSFFFLDPFGYTDFSMQHIRRIMHLGKVEILLTYMIDFIQRFLEEKEGKLRDAFHLILEADDYYTLKDLRNIDTIHQQEYLRNETIRLFRDRTGVKYIFSFSLLANKSIVKYYLVHLSNHQTALRVLKDSLWKHNNIDLSYGYNYGIYGVGHITPEYLEDKIIGSLFEIKDSNRQAAIKSLEKYLMPSIEATSIGKPFNVLERETIQENPSSKDIYEDFLNQMRTDKDILIYRNNKVTNSKRILANDIIRKNPQTRFIF
jgi:three-Cys-motif partner protein